MNANELADELQKMFVGEEYDRLVHEIPDLLRQQQAEIEALNERCAFLEDMAVMVHTPAFPKGLNKTLRDLLDKAPIKDKP